MVFGNLTYENEGMTNQNNNFEIYNYEYDKTLGYEKPEIEAFIIANDIKNKATKMFFNSFIILFLSQLRIQLEKN